jgi:hypothetical protein
MFRRLLIIVLLGLCFCGQVIAQKPIPNQDSLSYRAFEKFSQKTKFTRFLHHLIFKPLVAKKPNRHAKKNKIIKPKPYYKVEGKIVREIRIISQDPFGYHIQDTSMVPKGFLVKAGNTLHLQTQPGIIKNQLLFKENEPFDSLLVKESERLLRSQKYIRDVLFYTTLTSAKADSVDVYIRVWDVWSIAPAFNLSKSTIDIELTDINFAGLGQSLKADMQWNRPTGDRVTRIGYLIPNIRNSHISFNLRYFFPGNNDLNKSIEYPRPVYSPKSSNLQNLFFDNNYLVKSIEFERLFFSPVAKWAEGLFLGQLLTAQSYFQQDTIRYLSSLTNIQDYWAANSWKLLKGNSAKARTTNFILSGRLLKTRYPERSPEAETANVFNNETIYFVGIGITSRKYIHDKYIFKIGKVEDVPVGRALGMTIGLDVQQPNQWYLGLKAAWGKYYRFGYLSTHLEYGTFIGTTGFQQEVLTGRINYYTRLFNLGNWKLRQFIKPTFIIGKNRLPTDNLTFSEGMKGFEGLAYPATNMSVLTLQTQSYAPLNLIGFHFGPYIFSSFGMLGNSSTDITHSRLYSILGLGVLIKNDFLMFSTFQISMSFYPSIPGIGSNIFRTNAYKTNDYGFRDFEISKPGVVDYR